MGNPKISIITVCYNSKAHLEEAINSVLNQTYSNKEYIVIDGGSTDGTLDIINKYRDKIDYFVSEKDSGISDAFNKGIKAATGDIIGICNADDQLAPDCMQILANNYEEGVDIYRMNEVVKNFETGEEFLTKPTLVYGHRLINNYTCHMGCFVSKTAYEKYGMYDVDLRIQMDTDLLCRFSAKGAKYKYIDANCGFFRRGGVSTTEISRKNYERKLILKRYGASKSDIFYTQFCHRFSQMVKRILLILHLDPTKVNETIKALRRI